MGYKYYEGNWGEMRARAKLQWDKISYDELEQLAIQDEAMITDQVVEDDSLLVTLAANTDFQYINDADDNDEYNRLLWEMVDDETLMEDWL